MSRRAAEAGKKSKLGVSKSGVKSATAPVLVKSTSEGTGTLRLRGKGQSSVRKTASPILPSVSALPVSSGVMPGLAPPPATFGTPAGTVLSVFLTDLGPFFPERLPNSPSSHFLVDRLTQLRLMGQQEASLSQTISEAVDARAEQLHDLEGVLISRAREACLSEGRSFPEVLVLPEDVSESSRNLASRGGSVYNLVGQVVGSLGPETGGVVVAEEGTSAEVPGEAKGDVRDVEMGDEEEGEEGE
jgi:hypothetical protein